MDSSEKTYFIQLTNDVKLNVDVNFVYLSNTFKNLLGDCDCGDESEIGLPVSNNWSNQSYKELYKAYNTLIQKQPDYFEKLAQNVQYQSPDNRCLTETEQELKFTTEQYPILFEMLSVANFLDMNTFIQLLSKIIAHKINEARVSNSDQDIHNLLGNPEIELTPEQQQFYNEKVEVLESLKMNEKLSM